MPCALLLQFVNLFLQVDYVEGEFLDFPEQVFFCLLRLEGYLMAVQVRFYLQQHDFLGFSSADLEKIDSTFLELGCQNTDFGG